METTSIRVKNLNETAASARAMRRANPVAIEHTGGQRTIFGCLCGARHTCATDYRDAKHVARFVSEHNDTCSALWDDMAAKRTPEWMAAQIDAIYSRD